MSEVAQPYVFPSALIGRADLARLLREVEAVDNDLEAQKARTHTTGQAGYKLPVTSRSLSDFLEINQLNLTDDHVRMTVKEHLRVQKDKAPIIHMTFAAEADPEFLQQLVAWLRQEIHPQTLLTVGLQPSLVGGVYMRTPNHVHDFSLRALLAGKRDIIMGALDSALRAVPVAAAPGEVAVIVPETADIPVVIEPAVPAATAPESAAAPGSVEPAEPAEAPGPATTARGAA